MSARAEDRRKHLGDLGLADAGLALEQDRAAEPQRRKIDGRQGAVADVVVLRELALDAVDGQVYITWAVVPSFHRLDPTCSGAWPRVGRTFPSRANLARAIWAATTMLPPSGEVSSMVHRLASVIAAVVVVAASTSSPHATPVAASSASAVSSATSPSPSPGPSTTAPGTAPAESPSASIGPGGSGSSPDPATAEPQPSAVGAPEGQPVTANIGSAGGTLAAADGGISVTIPPGALAADTTIGIQPIENTAPNGLDGAYRLTPVGQTFSQPVQIDFPYTDSDVDGSAPEALGIAFQDAEGFWEWQDATAVDLTTQQLVVSMTHFTDFAKAPGLQLRPLSASVHVNGTLQLVVTNCLKERGNPKAVLFPCFDLRSEDIGVIDPASWAVNGTPKGTLATGTVEGTVNLAAYFAPPQKPKAGPNGKSTVKVTVTAHLLGKTKVLSANVRIIDGYRVKGTWVQTNSSRVCSGAISPKITDTVEFSLSPATVDGEQSFLVTDIKNAKTTAKPPKFPVHVPETAVRQAKPPEILTLNGGDVTIDGDQIAVALVGSGFTGSCTFIDTTNGGKRTPPGTDTEESALLKFFTTQMVDGKLSVPGTVEQPWSWFVTEQ